jgi:hypothetical protein
MGRRKLANFGNGEVSRKESGTILPEAENTLGRAETSNGGNPQSREQPQVETWTHSSFSRAGNC